MLQVKNLCPQLTDAQQFESDYAKHIELFQEKMGIPANVKPYTITEFLPTPGGLPHYCQMFSMPLESPEALQAALTNPSMPGLGADGIRISTSGAPVTLIGLVG